MPTQTSQQQSKALAYSQFQDDIARQLEELKKQQVRIKLFQSDLDLLKKQYELNPSRFTRAAQWYQQHSWYQKLILKAEVAVLALSLGILINGLALIVIASAYFALTYLFDDYNKAEKNRRETLCHNILLLEQELQANIESFSQLQSKFLRLCEVTQEQQSTLASCIATLSQESLQLQAQMKSLMDATKQHVHHTKEFDEQVHTFSERLQKQQVLFQQTFNKASSAILEQQASDGRTSLSITSISQDVSKLEQAIARLDKELAHQEQLAAAHATRCDDLVQTISQVKQSHVEIGEGIASHHAQSDDGTRQAMVHSEQVLQQSLSIQQKARSALEKARSSKKSITVAHTPAEPATPNFP